MINQFSEAIRHQKISDFLLGKGEYLYLDRDRGVHDPTTSGMIVADYGNIVGCDEMSLHLNSGFRDALGLSVLSLNDVQNLLAFIFFWKSYREHRPDSLCKWELPSETTKVLVDSYSRLRVTGDATIVDSLVERLYSRFSWPS